MARHKIRSMSSLRFTLITTLRLALAAVFFYAAVVKARDSRSFAVALLPFTFVPEGWDMTIALSLTYAEMLAGLLILLPGIWRVGAILICGLCLLFIGVLSWALANGIVVDCGCFGPEDEPTKGKMWLALGRDVLIFLASAAVYHFGRGGSSPSLARPPGDANLNP